MNNNTTPITNDAANNTNNSWGGFTLVEVIIYVALLGLLLLFVSDAVFSLIRSAAEVRIERTINNSAVFALEKMLRAVRDGNDIVEQDSVFDSNPGALSVAGVLSGTSWTKTFSVLDGATLVLAENGGANVPLTASDVRVSNLVFREIVGTSSAVKIEMEIENTRGPFNRSRYYQATAVLRGSYEGQ